MAIGLNNLGQQGLRNQIQTTEGLDRAFDWLVEELTRIAKASTPRKKANNGFQAPWWTAGVQEAARQARQAKRLQKATLTAYNKA